MPGLSVNRPEAPDIYTEGHKSLRKHTQRYAYLTPGVIFKINGSKDEYTIYCDAVYNLMDLSNYLKI